jgi:general secretion pathway protein I
MNRPPLKLLRGFTLLEVLVALVIVSLGMMAVKTQVDRYVFTARFMEEKTLASWIASNKITELSIQPDWPELGRDTDEIEFARRMWEVRSEVTETEVENLRRVDVDVALADAPDTVIQRLSGLIEPPAPQGFVPVEWVSAGFGGGETGQ